MNKQFEYVKEYIKKGNRLLVFYNDTAKTHKEMQWDIILIKENFINEQYFVKISREYVTGELKNEPCRFNTDSLSEGKINVDMYVVKEEF